MTVNGIMEPSYNRNVIITVIYTLHSSTLTGISFGTFRCPDSEVVAPFIILEVDWSIGFLENN